MASEYLNSLLENGGGSGDLHEVAERAQRSTVQIRIGRHAGGSGTVWQEHVVVTNAHVAVRNPIEVVTSDGLSMTGEVIARHPQDDLAAIRVEAGSLVPAVVGDSSKVRPGQLVFSVGNPMGMANSLAVGVVHAIGRPAPGRSHALVQADIRLAPGYSGGPMLDAGGNVIGINTMISGGLGLAIPSNGVGEFLATSSRPRMGLTLQPVTFPAGRQSSGAGLLLTEVLVGSPAALAGLYVGDIIVAANDGATARPQDLASALRDPSPVRVQVLRGSRMVSIAVHLGGAEASSAKRAA